MKILSIAGHNLASLAEPFRVDFRLPPLRDAGLFAICGPTGAGKSTLLDALCLALYDDTPRLTAAGVGGGLPEAGDTKLTPRDTAHLLRRGAGEGEAVVEFMGNDGVEYRARWSLRRARNRPDGKLQKVEMSLSRCDDGVPIGHLKTEVLKAIRERVGLDFAQFTRAVLLAQNEFAAFLKADDDGRAELLQTLTGTDTFEAISIATFARARDEGQRLAELEQQRALHPVLAAEARAELDAEVAVLHARIESQQSLREQLELAARWHDDARALANAVASARQASADAAQAHEGATPRRVELARIDAARGARAEVQACEQAQRELDEATTAHAAAVQREQEARAAHTEAEAHTLAAQVAHAEAMAEQSRAAPGLAQAHALDAQLAERERARAEAEDEAGRAQRESEAASVALAAGMDALSKAEARRDEARAWLAANAHLRTLGEQWARWDAALQEAAAASTELAEAKAVRDGCDAALGRAQVAAAAAARAAIDTGTIAAQAIEAEEASGAAVRALDAVALAQARRAAEVRRELLARASEALRMLDDARARRDTLVGALEADESEAAACEAGHRAVHERIAPAEAALAQAQLALQRAQVALAADVERLREGLADGEPCPVCGATTHPWRTAVPAFDALLVQLQADARECAEALRALERDASALATRASAAAARAEVARAAQPGMEQALEAGAQAWADAALAMGLDAGMQGAAPPVRRRWVDEAQADNREALADCAAREAALARARDAAMMAANERRRAEEASALAREAAARAEGEVNRSTAAQAASVERHAGAVQRLAQRLATLDAAFAQPGAVVLEDWRVQWAADPLQFHAHWRTQAESWRRRVDDERSASEAALAAAAQERSARAAMAVAESAARRGATIAEAARIACEGVRADRAALFGGRSTEDVANVLAEAVRVALLRMESARANLMREQQADAAAATTRAEAALRVQRAAAALEVARAALERWRAAWPLPEVPAPEAVELGALMALDEAALARDREALQRLDAALADARVRLDEREQQHARHLMVRPDAREAADIAEQTGTLVEALDAARATLGELQLRQRMDDDHGQQGRALDGAIEAQRSTTRTWRQLSELVGSADGRKFRNYAQQLTLEVLLAHANVHLASLARRYRLERGEDSLSLRVVDQDMADERRLVHSLSGGESFLVSLGLALGLASLSSHRVRVESLFIDEGFGSLDPETLRVAMDALDVLQSQGRKVGVISHVPEMTERIGTRIEVRRGSGGRSTVAVC